MRLLHYLLENACIQAQAERKVFDQLLSTSFENNEMGTINKPQPGELFYIYNYTYAYIIWVYMHIYIYMNQMTISF